MLKKEHIEELRNQLLEKKTKTTRRNYIKSKYNRRASW